MPVLGLTLKIVDDTVYNYYSSFAPIESINENMMFKLSCYVNIINEDPSNIVINKAINTLTLDVTLTHCPLTCLAV